MKSHFIKGGQEKIFIGARSKLGGAEKKWFSLVRGCPCRRRNLTRSSQSSQSFKNYAFFAFFAA
ncbi:MAG: hypothetical protein IJH67_14000 [Thermoguttaceae bacterium]|nr:hypothetical protein [Thermoguttaceae bacterium]